MKVVRYDNDRGDWMSSGDRYCGRQLPATITTYSEKIRLIFRSNQAINGEGFRVRGCLFFKAILVGIDTLVQPYGS